MLTEKQKEQAIKMFEAGCSFGYVAKVLGYNKTTIWEMFHKKYTPIIKAKREERQIITSKCPALKRWLIENDVTMDVFADMCYLSRSTIDKLLRKGIATADTLEQICRVTGMSEENLLQK